MANAVPQLQEAYELIESGDLQSARQLLDDIRSDNENNPDFWWIYAHAVEDENDGIAALDRVRQLAPNYPDLQNLSQDIGLTPVQPPAPPTFAPPSTDDVEDFYEENDDFEPQASTGGGSGLMPYVVITGIVVVVILLALFLLSNLLGGNDGTTTGTEVADATTDSSATAVPTFDSASFDATSTSLVESIASDEPTEAITTDEPVETEEPTEAIATDEPVETEEPATEIPTDEPSETPEPATETPTDEPSDTPEPEESDPFADVYEALAESGVPEEGIVLDETDSFGDTYMVTTCSALGPVATANILNIMDELESVADDIDESVEGFAFNISDCSTDTVRLTLGFDRATADSYWSGEIGQDELQQALQRVN